MSRSLRESCGGFLTLCGEENGAGAGAKDGAAFAGEIADGVVETFFLEELELRGAFAAGEDEAVAALEIGDGADFDGFRAEFVEHGGVGVEVALDGEDADFHRTILRFGAWRHFKIEILRACLGRVGEKRDLDEKLVLIPALA